MSARVQRFGSVEIHLGDALEILPRLGPVDHVITDPPYEQDMHDKHGAGSWSRQDGGALRRDLGFAGVDPLRPALVAWIAENCRGWFLAFCTVEGVSAWRAACAPHKRIRWKLACPWIKPDATPKLNGQGPALGYEMFAVAWVGKGHARWNAGGKRGVYTHLTNPRTRDGRHPTEKPLALMAELVEDFTAPGECILDPFAGSGSTLIAALRHGRAAIGIERDPGYFEIACERLAAEAARPDLLAWTPPRQERLALDPAATTEEGRP